MTTLVVHPADRPLVGSVPVPSDREIGHVALVVAALAEGDTTVEGWSVRDDDPMVACLRGLGVDLAERSTTELVVSGHGIDGWRQPLGNLDCRSSGAALWMLCGALAGFDFRSTLHAETASADAWQPLARIAALLRRRGASIDGRLDPDVPGNLLPPLHVGPLPGGRRLAALEYESPLADARANANLKGVLLLSGLRAEGPTLFREPSVSRDHVERLLGEVGVPIRTMGPVVLLDPVGWDGRIPAFLAAVPGDVSAASYLIAAAQLVPGSRLTVRRVGTNPTRTGLLEIARDMGAGLAIEPHGGRAGEPVADVHAWSGTLRGVAIGGETFGRAPRELAVAGILAARASGVTRFEADETSGTPARGGRSPLADVARMLGAFGVPCEERREGLDVTGTDVPPVGADFDSGGDPAIAMAASVLALAAKSPSRVRDAGCIVRAYPKFVATLRALGARIEVEA
jgi:3-phosphoshikimate 1-carboxyvinyltransferase